MPTLYIIATPIGNLEDITLRAIRVLGKVDVLACEDTRRTRILFERHGIPSPSKIISYREQNEKTSTPGIVKLIEEGKTVGLVSDAGFPGISDPGYRVIGRGCRAGDQGRGDSRRRRCRNRAAFIRPPVRLIRVSRISTAKTGQLRHFLEAEREHNHTLVMYESPLRTGELLDAALEVLGDRKAVVCIELTKMFESIHRGFLSELTVEFKEKKIKGKVTVVIAGNNRKFMNGKMGTDYLT